MEWTCITVVNSMLASKMSSLIKKKTVPKSKTLSSVVERFANLFVHLIGTVRRVDLSDQIQPFVVLNDGQSLAVVSLNALPQALLVVVRSTLTAIQTTLGAHLFRTNEEQHEFEIRLRSHLSFPTIHIVCVAREAVDQEAGRATRSVHRIFQEFTRDVDRDNGSIFDVFFYETAELRSFSFTLRPQQIAGAQMQIAKFEGNLDTLRPFATAWWTKYEDDVMTSISSHVAFQSGRLN